MNEDWPYSSLSVRKQTARRVREIRDRNEYSTDGIMRRFLQAYEEAENERD